MANDSDAEVQQSCCSTSGCCDNTSESNFIGRRQFIQATGLTAATMMAGSADFHASFFTAAEGYGLFTQTLRESQINASIDLAEGQLRLNEVVLA